MAHVLLYVLLFVLVSFLIVDSAISFYIVKDIDECKKDFFDTMNQHFRMLNREINQLNAHITEIHSKINKTGRARRKKNNDVKDVKFPNLRFVVKDKTTTVDANKRDNNEKNAKGKK